MIIRVDKDELKILSNDLINSSSNVSKEIETWEKSVEDLKKIWQGKDADVFYNRINIYLLKLRMLTESSNSIGTFIDKANNKYIEKDNDFADVLKRENDRNDAGIE